MSDRPISTAPSADRLVKPPWRGGIKRFDIRIYVRGDSPDITAIGDVELSNGWLTLIYQDGDQLIRTHWPDHSIDRVVVKPAEIE